VNGFEQEKWAELTLKSFKMKLFPHSGGHLFIVTDAASYTEALQEIVSDLDKASV
jgi:surfactin synthase thioesterase subunit